MHVLIYISLFRTQMQIKYYKRKTRLKIRTYKVNTQYCQSIYTISILFLYTMSIFSFAITWLNTCKVISVPRYRSHAWLAIDIVISTYRYNPYHTVSLSRNHDSLATSVCHPSCRLSTAVVAAPSILGDVARLLHYVEAQTDRQNWHHKRWH